MKIWLFRLIAISIPFVFFLVLELILRISGSGQSYPLFIDNPANAAYQLPRPDLIKRYFAYAEHIPNVSMEANFLLKQKPENGLRIFVQGGSTAAGFPYGLGASLAGMLDKRLKQTFPDKTVEVVNTAMAAVNSYTLLDIADEIIEQQPDAVLIYAGHNEYLGILGVGSNYTAANSNATTLLFLKVKEWRLFQLMQWLYAKFNKQAQEQPEQQASRTFMAKVAKHKNIEKGSAIYQAGLEQFTTNLDLLLSKYADAGIPVYIATLASNILDQKPFASQPIPEQTKIALAQPISVTSLTQLVEKYKDSNSADLFFAIGRQYATLGQVERAKASLEKAKDLDLLRFRASEDMNEIIRRQASKHKAFVVEAQQRFAQRAGGLVGNNLMLEHLHPNVEGYFLLSDAFYQALKQQQNFGSWQHVGIQQAWQERPITQAEEYFGYAKIRQLMSDYPFVAEKIPLQLQRPIDWQQALGAAFFEKKLSWIEMMQQAQKRFSEEKDTFNHLKVSLLIADALPHDAIANHQTADLLLKAKQPALATHYYQRAVLAGEISPSLYRKLAIVHKRIGNQQQANYWQSKL